MIVHNSYIETDDLDNYQKSRKRPSLRKIIRLEGRCHKVKSEGGEG